MLDPNQLIAVADLYRDLCGIEHEKTLSYRIFDDSKRLTAIRSGKDVTVRLYNHAMSYMAANWPASAPMPDSLKPYQPTNPHEAAE